MCLHTSLCRHTRHRCVQKWRGRGRLGCVQKWHGRGSGASDKGADAPRSGPLAPPRASRASSAHGCDWWCLRDRCACTPASAVTRVTGVCRSGVAGAQQVCAEVARPGRLGCGRGSAGVCRSGAAGRLGCGRGRLGVCRSDVARGQQVPGRKRPPGGACLIGGNGRRHRTAE